MLRLFFALWPEAPLQQALAGWQPALHKLCGGTPMLDITLHCTLVFLGETEAGRLEALLLAAQEVEWQGFDIRLDEARYWGHNHIAYAAPRKVPPQLDALVAALQQRLRRHRFPFQQHEYKPHVTLLRHVHWRDVPFPEMPPVHWQVNEFALMRSLGDEHGARYEVLARFPVRQPTGPAA